MVPTWRWCSASSYHSYSSGPSLGNGGTHNRLCLLKSMITLNNRGSSPWACPQTSLIQTVLQLRLFSLKLFRIVARRHFKLSQYFSPDWPAVPCCKIRFYMCLSAKGKLLRSARELYVRVTQWLFFGDAHATECRWEPSGLSAVLGKGCVCSSGQVESQAAKLSLSSSASDPCRSISKSVCKHWPLGSPSGIPCEM